MYKIRKHKYVTKYDIYYFVQRSIEKKKKNYTYYRYRPRPADRWSFLDFRASTFPISRGNPHAVTASELRIM